MVVVVLVVDVVVDEVVDVDVNEVAVMVEVVVLVEGVGATVVVGWAQLSRPMPATMRKISRALIPSP